jgi:hypothetical protein
VRSPAEQAQLAGQAARQAANWRCNLSQTMPQFIEHFGELSEFMRGKYLSTHPSRVYHWSKR